MARSTTIYSRILFTLSIEKLNLIILFIISPWITRVPRPPSPFKCSNFARQPNDNSTKLSNANSISPISRHQISSIRNCAFALRMIGEVRWGGVRGRDGARADDAAAAARKLIEKSTQQIEFLASAEFRIAARYFRRSLLAGPEMGTWSSYFLIKMKRKKNTTFAVKIFIDRFRTYAVCWLHLCTRNANAVAAMGKGHGNLRPRWKKQQQIHILFSSLLVVRCTESVYCVPISQATTSLSTEYRV